MTRHPRFHRTCLALALMLSLTPGHAQQAAKPAASPPAQVQETLPPYEPDLLRLAEIIGSLAYLRDICAARDAADWRDKMTGLLDSEGRTPLRRERLVSAYNRGFKAYASVHRACLPASEEASSRLAVDGERLAKVLAGRFGG